MARKKRHQDPINRTGMAIVKVFTYNGSISIELTEILKEYLKRLSISEAYILSINANLDAIQLDVNTSVKPVGGLIRLPIPSSLIDELELQDALFELHKSIDSSNPRLSDHERSFLIETYLISEHDISDPDLIL